LLEAARANGEDEVVFWTMSIHDSDRVFKPFENKYGIKVIAWDAPSGSSVVPKMIEEAKVGRYTPDVIILSELDMPDLINEGMLLDYEYPNRDDAWVNQPKHNFYVTHGQSLRAPMYNTDLVSPADVPTSWDDLKSDRWIGKSLVSSSADETPLIFAYHWGNKETLELNWDAAEAFWTEVLEATKPNVGRGFTTPTQLLVAGDSAIFFANSLNTGMRNMRKGAPINIAPVEFILGSNWALGIPKTTPNPNAAKLLTDWLTTDEGLFQYADIQELSTLNPRVLERQYSTQTMRALGVDIFTTPTERKIKG
jgi:iron(III) transport system substrate-binding protein